MWSVKGGFALCANSRDESVNRRLLVVDYDAVTAETLKLIFERQDYDVEACRTGEEGMSIAETWQPDIVIAAVILKGMNGLDFAKRVVARYPGCHVILLTTVVNPWMVDGARVLGLDLYTKPVYPAVLIDRVGVLLSGLG